MDKNKSTLYNEEQVANSQRIAIDQFQSSQSPRSYANGLKFSTLSPTTTGSDTGSGVSLTSGSDIFPIIPSGSGSDTITSTTFSSPQTFAPPILPIISNPTLLPRPIDPAEISAKIPPLISNLTKQVFDKNKFKETVDTTFSQLGIQVSLMLVWLR